MTRAWVLFLLVSFAFGETDSLLFVNGNIVTVNGRESSEQAMFIRGDRIQALGSTAELRRRYEAGARVIDLNGKTVIPGLIDTHTHALDWATAVVEGEIDLRYPKARSIADIKRLVGERARTAKPAEWILGRAWDDGALAEGRYVTRQDLDLVSRRNPVFLLHNTGHLATVNSVALKLAGITAGTGNPPGGVIDRDASGEPTGVLKDNAMGLVTRFLPASSRETRLSAIKYLSQACGEYGLTMIHDVALTPEQISSYEEARRRGILKVRVRTAPLIAGWESVQQLKFIGAKTGSGDLLLKFGGAKIFADGGMAAQTIAIYPPPVINQPGNFGLLLWKPADLESIQMALAEQGWQLTTHAIGDRAIDEVIDSYSKIAKRFPTQELRNRIIHCGIAMPRIQQRLKQEHILVDNNPPFVYFIGRHFAAYGKARERWAYPGKSYLDNRITVSGGSDVYVTPLSPWWGLWAAVVRKEMMSGEVIAPEERITVKQALRVYTWNGAYASFDEKQLGSLEPGKLADFVVLDRNLMTVPSDEIKDVKVLSTWVAGVPLFERH